MWILRRRLEVWFLLFALLPFAVGIRLPPPVGKPSVVTGPVERVNPGSDKTSLSFSVLGERLTSHHREPGYERLRSTIRPGQHARALVWSWIGEEPLILELFLDDERVVEKSPRLLHYWAVCMMLLAMAGMLWWVALWGFRSEETLWEKYSRGRRIQEERRKKRKP